MSFQGEPSSNSLACQDALSDPELDAQLDSLRNKLSVVIIVLLVVKNSCLDAPV